MTVTWLNWRWTTGRSGLLFLVASLHSLQSLSFFFLFFLFLFLFCFYFPGWYQFIFVYFTFKSVILHIVRIIVIIIRCSGIFRDVPGCSGMFHVPGFIDGRKTARRQKFLNFVLVFVYTVIRARVRTSFHKTLIAEKFLFLSHGETILSSEIVCAYELNKEITLVYPYFSVWLKSSNVTTLVFYEQRSLEVRDSHVIKLMANDWKEWISPLSCELSLIAVIFIFPSF